MAEKKEDNRRFFMWEADGVVNHLLLEAKIRPLPSKRARIRKGSSSGEFVLKRDNEYKIEIVDRGMAGLQVFCQPEEIKHVYRAFKETLNHLCSLYEAREIRRPILPQKIYDLIQESVFNFYEAINALGTTKGFGNVGLILAGPPGVGKSETMRWIGEEAHEKYKRGKYQLSLSELNKLLAEGYPLNANHALIFIDDIDANILRDRNETRNPLTSQFLTCLDGLEKREGRVIIVSTNEKVDKIDPALTRPGRFEHIIHFDYPTPDLIERFCKEKKIELNPNLFDGWSFARIDMFLAKFKVANYRYGTALNVFYEKFIHEMGEEDPTVARYRE